MVNDFFHNIVKCWVDTFCPPPPTPESTEDRERLLRDVRKPSSRRPVSKQAQEEIRRQQAGAPADAEFVRNLLGIVGEGQATERETKAAREQEREGAGTPAEGEVKAHHAQEGERKELEAVRMLGFENPRIDYNRCYLNSTFQILFRMPAFLDALHRAPRPNLTNVIRSPELDQSQEAFEARRKRIHEYEMNRHNRWLPLRQILLNIEAARNQNNFRNVSDLIGQFRRAAIDSGLNPELEPPYTDQKDPSGVFWLILSELGLAAPLQTFEGPLPSGSSDPQPVISIPILQFEEQILTGDATRNLPIRERIDALNNAPIILDEYLRNHFSEYQSGEPVRRDGAEVYLRLQDYLMEVPDIFVIYLKKTVTLTPLYRGRILEPLINQYMQESGCSREEAVKMAYAELNITVINGEPYRKIMNQIHFSRDWHPDMGFMVHPDHRGRKSTAASLKGVILHDGFFTNGGHYTNFVRDGEGIYQCDDRRVGRVDAAAMKGALENGLIYVFERTKGPGE